MSHWPTVRGSHMNFRAAIQPTGSSSVTKSTMIMVNGIQGVGMVSLYGQYLSLITSHYICARQHK